jgi:hypothetical protein
MQWMKTLGRTAAAGVLVVVAGAYALGCGEQSADLKSAFLKEGDAICERTDKEQEAGISAYSKKHPKALFTKSSEQRALVLAVGLPPILKEANALEALEPPPGDERQVEEIIRAIRRATKEAEADPVAVGKGLPGPFARPNQMAKHYGFKACSGSS